jgi:hypothetical protein
LRASGMVRSAARNAGPGRPVSVSRSVGRADGKTEGEGTMVATIGLILQHSTT